MFKAQNGQNEVILFIFNYWVNAMKKDEKRTKFGRERAFLIRNALRWGYSTRDLMQAIDGCSRLRFNQERKLNDLSTIFKNECSIEYYRDHSPEYQKDLKKSLDKKNKAC